jgi:azurin
MRRSLGIIALAALFAGAPASGQDCALTIEGNDQIQFNMNEMRVSAECAEVTVTLVHTGQLAQQIMGHNWVLTTTADYMPVATEGQNAGPPDYLPKGDPRIIATTGMIGGGERTEVTFDISALDPGGDNKFFCSFPGHILHMHGKFIIE